MEQDYGHPTDEGEVAQDDLSTEQAGLLLPAMIGGLVAALVGGAAWAIIVVVTKYEVGYAAWAIGAFVGLVMARLTTNRSNVTGVFAAGLAFVGLVVGKVLIIQLSITPAVIAKEIQADSDWMHQAAFSDLRVNNTFPLLIQERLDALAPNDTIPDTLRREMLAAAQFHARTADPSDKRRIAIAHAQTAMAAVPFSDLLLAQLSAWDLLWFGLAVSTAWKIMSTPSDEFDGTAEATT